MKKGPNIISPSFCSFGWNQIHITPTGVVKPCCLFDEGLLKENGEALRIVDGNVDEIWNSMAFRDLRKKMLNGDVISGCKKCIEEEKVYDTSERIRSFYEADFLDKLIIESMENDGQVSKLPAILNLKIGNLCNLKCRMCQPLDSCMVDAEFREISKTTPLFRFFDNASAFDYNYDLEPIEIAGNWITNEQALLNLRMLLKNTKDLSLAGGEITYTKEAMEFLKFCIDEGFAREIDLVVSTNLTKITDEIINIFASFKSTRIAASVDGVGPVLEYIRYPSKWSVVEGNLNKLINAPENVIPVIAPTVQIYNILSIVDVFELIENYLGPKWERVNPCHLTILIDPEHLSIRHLPRKIKQKARERLLEFYKRSRLFGHQSVYHALFKLLLETLNQDQQENSAEQLGIFMQYTQELDKQRHQRMQDFLPELYQDLQEFNIVPHFPKKNIQSFSFYRYRDRGFRLYDENKIEEAKDMFLRAFELVRDDDHTLFSLGQCYKASGELEKAKEFFLLCYGVNNKHFYNLLELSFLEEQSANMTEALRYVVEAKEYGPEEKKGFCENRIQNLNCSK